MRRWLVFWQILKETFTENLIHLRLEDFDANIKALSENETFKTKFRDADTDGDGKLSKEEWRVMCEGLYTSISENVANILEIAERRLGGAQDITA